MIKITFKPASPNANDVQKLRRLVSDTVLRQPVRSAITVDNQLSTVIIRIDHRIYEKGFVNEDVAILIAQFVGIGGLEGYDLEVVTDKLEYPF